MTKPAATVIVTGVSGIWGSGSLPLLGEFRIIGVDLQPPDSSLPLEFHAMNLGHEASCRELTQLIRNTDARTVVHLAFVMILSGLDRSMSSACGRLMLPEPRG